MIIFNYLSVTYVYLQNLVCEFGIEDSPSALTI